MSSKNILIILLMLCLGVFVSCLDEIDFIRPETDPIELVIQGVFTKGAPNVVQVEVSNVFGQSGFVSPRLVSGNDVMIYNDKGQSKVLKELSQGKYEVRIFDGDPDFSVDFQTAYKVYVRSINGDEYESAFETLNKVPKIEQLDVKMLTKKVYDPNLDRFNEIPAFEYSISTSLLNPDGNGKSILRWNFIETYRQSDTPRGSREPKTCYYTENAQIVRLVLVNGKESNADRLDNFAVYETDISSKFAEGYYLTVVQESLSESAYDYWEQIRQVTDRSGNMFESPAGNVNTNFTPIQAVRPVAGFFYATESDTVRMYISPGTAKNPTTFCPPPLATFGCDLCCDCLQHPTSTLEKPFFWIE